MPLNKLIMAIVTWGHFEVSLNRIGGSSILLLVTKYVVKMEWAHGFYPKGGSGSMLIFPSRLRFIYLYQNGIDRYITGFHAQLYVNIRFIELAFSMHQNNLFFLAFRIFSRCSERTLLFDRWTLYLNHLWILVI